MIRQILFASTLLLTLAVFTFTTVRIVRLFLLTKPAFPVRNIGSRILVMLKVAFGQTKILRRPVIGFFHAVVFWGFCVILFGSIEMVTDGLAGTDRALMVLGPVYDFFTASGDIFAPLIAVSILVFLARRTVIHIRRFDGIEMKKISHLDANIALLLIFFLMVSLSGINMNYLALKHHSGSVVAGVYPFSSLVSGLLPELQVHALRVLFEISWWSHILLIFLFANILPYSKHFHVFMSVPNVFLSRLDPLGKLPNMDAVTREVKLMLDPSLASTAPETGPPERFGIRDCEDVSWKNYLDSLSCTECGRCTSVCPANITGKRLSPRKIMMDVRARMKEKGPGLVKQGKEFNDKKSLLRDYITEEELWACTTCNACAKECPININQPTVIVDMRRYLVMEEGSAPAALKACFSNIENNGAPWKFSPEDRLLWTNSAPVPVMADLFARGEKPEYLFWVGCAGAFDDRYKKVAQVFVKILTRLGVNYAVLGKEESCNGDPARRAGNEMLYQMQALHNIGLFTKYGVTRIFTICPHCYNIFKNEYPDLGGNYEVIHYTQFLAKYIAEGKLKPGRGAFGNQKITYHDPCYLGRANNIYSEPREILHSMTPGLVEMDRHKSFALCCGAGGAQMFKEAEKGEKEVFIERTEEALLTEASIIASACPFCMTMLTDGIKYRNKEDKVRNLDIGEMIAEAMDL